MSEASENQNSWFSAVSWKTAVILSALAFLSGGTGGGIVATKGVAAAGVTQDQGDVRYLKKEEANAWRNARDRQLETIDGKMVTKEVFDERTNMILRNQDLERDERKKDREYLEKLILSQNQR